jgi:hypothetical protein
MKFDLSENKRVRSFCLELSTDKNFKIHLFELKKYVQTLDQKDPNDLESLKSRCFKLVMLHSRFNRHGIIFDPVERSMMADNLYSSLIDE